MCNGWIPHKGKPVSHLLGDFNSMKKSKIIWKSSVGFFTSSLMHSFFFGGGGDKSCRTQWHNVLENFSFLWTSFNEVDAVFVFDFMSKPIRITPRFFINRNHISTTDGVCVVEISIWVPQIVNKHTHSPRGRCRFRQYYHMFPWSDWWPTCKVNGTIEQQCYGHLRRWANIDNPTHDEGQLTAETTKVIKLLSCSAFRHLSELDWGY